MKVLIDGKVYREETPSEETMQKLLREVYSALWAEAYYDPTNERLQMFAKPLADRMCEVNKILRFKE